MPTIPQRSGTVSFMPRLSYQQMVAQSAIFIFTLVFGMMLILGAANLVRPLYPAVALITAVMLFSIQRGQYVAFVIWLFMITPFVRRVVDYQAGYQDTSTVMLAPLLAAAVACTMLVKKLPLLYTITFLPFLFVLVGLLYAYFIGIVNSGPLPATYDLLLWVVPLAFGFAIASDWRSFPMYRDSIFRAFLWGGAVLGAYGIYQYFFLPVWDAHWMRNAATAGFTSIGYPFPLQVRVFGTMNGPTAYGAMMMPALLIVLVASNWMRFPTGILGLGGFALSIVRTAWLGWAVGVAFLMLKLRGGRRLKLVVGLMAMAMLALPVLTSGDIGERFLNRLDTFGDLEGDKSYQARQELYGMMTERALTNVIGTGVGAVGVATKLSSGTGRVEFNIDSGLLFVPYTLGWPGALLMLIGVSALLIRPPGIVDRRNETAVQVGTAVCMAMIAMMLSYNSMYGVGGMIFWTFMGLRLCGRLWSASK
jgi:hypothetical protein